MSNGDKALVNPKEIANPDEKIFTEKIRNLASYNNPFLMELADSSFSESLEKLKWLLERASNVYLSSHEGLDPDGLGSQMALLSGLKSLGIPVSITNSENVSSKYSFFVNEHEFWEIAENHYWHNLENSMLILVDTNEFARIGRVYPQVKDKIGKLFIIDHHVCDAGKQRENLINTKSASTGEIVFQVFKYLGCEITHPIAKALYCAILSDTGNFKYQNTSALTHKIVAELVKYNLNIAFLYENIFQNYRPGVIYLLGAVLRSMRLEMENRLAILEIKREDFSDAGVRNEDSDNIVNLPLKYQGVVGSMLFRENKNGILKVSLRSVGDINVAIVAGIFKGGGHKNAAGANLENIMDKERIIQEFKKEISTKMKLSIFVKSVNTAQKNSEN